MTNIVVKVPSDRADKFLALLHKVHEESHGEERAVVDELLKEFSAQQKIHAEKTAQKTEQMRFVAATHALRDPVLNALPMVEKRGVTKEVLAYVHAVNAAFAEAEKRLANADKAHKKTLPVKQRANAELPIELFEKALSPVQRKIVQATEHFCAVCDTPMIASSAYTEADKRQRLAKSCFRSSVEQGAQAKTWDELNMIAMCFSDMQCHVDLGVAILSGSVSRIKEAASHIDTTPRENLDRDVLRFVYTHADNIKKVSARRPHK